MTTTAKALPETEQCLLCFDQTSPPDFEAPNGLIVHGDCWTAWSGDYDRGDPSDRASVDTAAHASRLHVLYADMRGGL